MTPVRLHLGCGHVHMDGWLNCDLTATAEADITFDLMQAWPFRDASVTTIYASHVLEHLPDPMTFFAEAWRVLQPLGSSLVIRVPHGGHSSAWNDLTHIRPWYPQTFACVQPGYAQAIGNPQSEQWTAFFGLQPVRVRVARAAAAALWIPGLRRLLTRVLSYVPELLEEIYVEAYPLKDDVSRQRYQAAHFANGVAIMYVAYAHDKARETAPAGAVTLLPL